MEEEKVSGLEPPKDFLEKTKRDSKYDFDYFVIGNQYLQSY